MIDIYQLSDKIDIMARVMHAAGRIENSTVKLLAEACGLRATTLQTAKNKNRTVSQKVEDALAFGCGFSATHPSWKDPAIVSGRGADTSRLASEDPNRDRKDNAWQFEAYLRDTVLATRTLYELQPQNSWAPSPTTFIEAFSGQGVNPGESIPIFCEWSVEIDVLDDGIRYGHRNLEIALHARDPNNPEVTNVLIEPLLCAQRETVPLDRTTLKRRSRQAPIWTQTAADGYIKGDFAITDSALAKLDIRDFPAEITIELRAFRSEDKMASDDGTLISDVAHPNKARLAEALLNRSAGEQTTCGTRIVLSRQRLLIVKRDANAALRAG